MAVTINGTTGVSQVQDGIVTDDKLDLSANSAEVKEALNASGTAPIYACRAWVNFDGTGTVSIRASGNVSSITDNGTGDYTVNFTTAMPDANYSAVTSGSASDADNSYSWDAVADNLQASSFRMASAGTSNNLIDGANSYAAIFR